MKILAIGTSNNAKSIKPHPGLLYCKPGNQR